MVFNILSLPQIENQIYNKIIYFSLDYGIIWNYHGDKYPTTKIWTWCVEDTQKIVSYINGMWSKGTLPILYSENRDIELHSKIISHFDPKPPTFQGGNLKDINECIKKSWRDGQNIIPYCGIELSRDVCVFNYGFYQSLEFDLKICDIGLDPISKIREYQIVILVGHDSRIRDSICRQFGEWVIISSMIEKDHLEVMFKKIIDKAIPGIIVNTNDSLSSDREHIIDICRELKIKFGVGWITSPSPKKFRIHIPTRKENGFRLL